MNARQPVTLQPDLVDRLFHILIDVANASFAHAERTKSAAIREHCRTRGFDARDIADLLVRESYVSR